MIDFLEKYRFDEEALANIINNNTESILFDLSCNDDNCIKIIDYMISIGISNIDDLLAYKIDVFFIDFEEFVKRIGKFNVPLVVDLINNDYNTIDVIYNA